MRPPASPSTSAWKFESCRRASVCTCLYVCKLVLAAAFGRRLRTLATSTTWSGPTVFRLSTATASCFSCSVDFLFSFSHPNRKSSLQLFRWSLGIYNIHQYRRVASSVRWGFSSHTQSKLAHQTLRIDPNNRKQFRSPQIAVLLGTTTRLLCDDA